MADTYKVTLLRFDGTQQTRNFSRLGEAILWVARELDSGDGHSVYGEVRFEGNVLWRKERGQILCRAWLNECRREPLKFARR